MWKPCAEGWFLLTVDTAALQCWICHTTWYVSHLPPLFVLFSCSTSCVVNCQVMAMERGQKLPHLVVNWGGDDADTWRARLAAQGPGLVVNMLRKHGVPQRLAEALCADAGVGDSSMSALRKAERQALLTALTAYELPCTGHEGYSKAEVTGGGVPLAEVDCRTMESRLLPGCFVCGEVLDVHGRIGGFNFFWAWVTGHAAGRAAGRHAAMQACAVPSAS